MSSPVGPGTPTLSGAVSATAGSSSSGAGGAYFGVGKETLNGGLGHTHDAPTYGPYDPSAVVPYAGDLGAGANGLPILININAAAGMYYQWSADQQNAFRAKVSLLDSQYLTANDQSLANEWASLVNQSATYHSNGTNLTPWDILAKDIASNNGGKGKGGQTIDKTISTTQLTSAPDSNAIFQSAAQALIGRAPTADEMKAFQSSLNAQERANPVVQQKELTYSPQGYVTDTNVLKSSGGETDAARQNLAMQSLRETPEYANYQASTTYMGALQELLSGGKV